jgi:hypothetical protein
VEGKVLAPVQREGEDPRIVREDLRRAVALMNVAVHHRDASQPALAQQPGGGHGNVIEDAESRAFAAKGVVGASREHAAIALLQRGGGSGKGSANAAQRTLDERLRPGQADPADGLWPQRTAHEGSDVSWIVYPPDSLQRGLWRGFHGEEAVALQLLAQQAVLAHGELVSLGEQNGPVIAVE